MKGDLDRSDALELLLSRWTPERKTEVVPLEEALGRVSAEPLYAKYNIPLVRAAGMDGVAVDSSAFAAGCPNMSRWQRGVEFDRADTGDDFDDRYDAVIRIEDVSFPPEGGLALREGVTVRAGMHVRPSGSTLRKGACIARPGLTLRATDLSAIAMGGYDSVRVLCKPRVVFIPTGSELVPAGEPLKRGYNYDSNSVLAVATLREMGAEASAMPIQRDDPEKLRSALLSALDDADLVIINGGSSKGSEDFNATLLSKEGELLFHGVSASPGRPMAAAMVHGKPVINLAGPAIAAFFGLEWCIRPLLHRFLGLPLPVRTKVQGKLTAPMGGPDTVEFLTRVEVYRHGNGYCIRPLDRMAVDLTDAMQSNGFCISPIGRGEYEAGEVVEAELLREPWELPLWPEDTPVPV